MFNLFVLNLYPLHKKSSSNSVIIYTKDPSPIQHGLTKIFLHNLLLIFKKFVFQRREKRHYYHFKYRTGYRDTRSTWIRFRINGSMKRTFITGNHGERNTEYGEIRIISLIWRSKEWILKCTVWRSKYFKCTVWMGKNFKMYGLNE